VISRGSGAASGADGGAGGAGGQVHQGLGAAGDKSVFQGCRPAGYQRMENGVVHKAPPGKNGEKIVKVISRPFAAFAVLCGASIAERLKTVNIRETYEIFGLKKGLKFVFGKR